MGMNVIAFCTYIAIFEQMRSEFDFWQKYRLGDSRLTYVTLDLLTLQLTLAGFDSHRKLQVPKKK